MAGQHLSLAEHGPDAIRRAFEECISGGGVALFPAEGVYGLACDAVNGEAVGRIHSIKGRDDGKSSAVMYFSPHAIRELIGGMAPEVRAAVAALLPGPVTVIVPNPEHRYPLACREDPERLGVRLIGGPLSGAMTPVFQTSANPSGEPAPYRLTDIDPGIRSAVDLAIDGGELGGEPSTVVDLTGLAAGRPWQVLREGAVSAEHVGQRLSGASVTSGREDRG